jgi:hypothetical protein
MDSPSTAEHVATVRVSGSDDPFQPAVPGGLIGRYKLLQQIGQGGCGVVYMAEQMAPVKRRVALKVIKPGMDTREVLGRFEAERQALALMDHPNIAKVLEAVTKTADHPIRFTVEDFAVVVSPRPGNTPTLYAKRFRVDHNKFAQAIEKAPLILSDTTNSAAQVHQMIRAYFTGAGVDFSPPKAIFFNDRLGELLVRGSLKDLEIIEQAIKSLNQP